MDQTTAHLRKTFKYPIDNNEDDDLPDAMDEEGQPSLLTPPFLPTPSYHSQLIFLYTPL